jgi:hypothetical protein
MAKGKPNKTNLRRGDIVYRVLDNVIWEIQILSRPRPHSWFMRKYDHARYVKWRRERRERREQPKDSFDYLFGIGSLMDAPVVLTRTLRFRGGDGVWRDSANRGRLPGMPHMEFCGDLIGHDRWKENGNVHSFFSRRAAESHVRNHYIGRRLRDADCNEDCDY